MSLDRFPRDPSKRREWITALALKDEDIKDYQRVCSRHFPNADPRNKPELCVGKRFASPKKSWTSRAKRAETREVVRSLTPQMSSCSAHSVTPGAPSVTPEHQSAVVEPPLIATLGEQLDSHYTVHELPTDDAMSELQCSTLTSTVPGSANALPDQNAQVLVNTALLARIEALESENKRLKELTSTTRYSQKVHH